MAVDDKAALDDNAAGDDPSAGGGGANGRLLDALDQTG
jgi:hypothetical protein